MALFVVATPIGNRQDLSGRAVASLREVAVIYAEDTRHSRPLLQHAGIETPLRSFHEHSDDARVEAIVAHALREDVALISDAGTPAISDPGYRVVRALRAAGGRVVPVPGPSAVIAFLSASGLPTDAFTFVGFPPRKAKARREALARWLQRSETTVCYESPKRVVAVLDDLAALAPSRQVVFARELTKLHETFVSGNAVEVAQEAGSWERVRGECVVGWAGAPQVDRVVGEAELSSWASRLAATALRSKEIATILADQLGVGRRDAYAAVLRARETER